MEDTYQSVITLAVSLAIGLLVGIERSWSDRDGKEGSRIAGLRTFSLIGLLGGVAVLLGREVGVWFVGVAFVGVAALSITAHVLDVQEDQDLGTTTAFSMMLVFALAAWAAYGAVVPAMAVTVVVIALLGYKPVLHSWLQMISPQDFFAGAKLLFISVVLLPLLPEAMKAWFGDYGVYALSVVSGIMDVDAITLSLAKSARQSAQADVAIVGILLACATNTVVKGIMFATISGTRQAIRLPVFMGVAMLPGLLVVLLW